MIKPFLQLVAEHIRDQYKDSTEKLCIVLPGRRGAVFLKSHLASAFKKTIWLPEMISAEDLINELSGLQTPDETELVCHLYESYSHCQGGKAESFESFAKWGQIILHDFNEIDRYLADSEQVYENLRDIKEIENWSLAQAQLSEQQQRYLDFMGSLGAIYKHFRQKMLATGKAWPGLGYRMATQADVVEAFGSRYEKILFCGFNALNTAEISIFDKLFKSGKAEMLWDADTYYLDNEDQEAGLFLRNNLNIFREKEPKFINSYFREKKSIEVVSVPKQMGQGQVVRQCLQDLHSQGISFDKVAVVLANEKLLWPVLQQLPPEVDRLNITMEYPLRFTASYDLVDTLLLLHQNYAKQQRSQKTIYHRDLSLLLRQPLFQHYLKAAGAKKKATDFANELTRRNLVFLGSSAIQELFDEDWSFVSGLLLPGNATTIRAELKKMLVVLADAEAQHYSTDRARMELEHIAILLRSLNRLEEIMISYGHFNEIAAFRQLFVQVTGSASVPFLGEPLQGLQIMGVLETRTLDFDHLIFVNVNEGVLPSGKTINSFIPNDLKRANGLPLYTEKDAVYAYHFYRLIQRAKTVTITFDVETDTFGKGERSRFVTQLQLEMNRYNPAILITEKVAVFPGLRAEPGYALSIQKNEEVMKRIVDKAVSADKYGALSPSGLTMFKQCSLRFFLRYGVQLKETDEVEEDPEAGTFGSILHLSLENLYKSFSGSAITEEALRKKTEEAAEVVESSFRAEFGRSELSGKSLLQIEVIKVYVKKLLLQDLRFIENLKPGKLTLLFLEHEFSAVLELPGSNPEKIFVRGKIDRIDRHGDIVRVIDYKSSVKTSDKFIFTGFEELFYDPDYDKQLQLFVYAWLLWKNGIAPAKQLQPAIIPFKAFSEKPKHILDASKHVLVFSDELLRDFELALSSFVATIFKMDLPFTQTEDRKICEYCAYNTVCNFHP